MNALTLQVARNYAARDVQDAPPQEKAVRLSLVAIDQSLRHKITSGVALADSKFHTAAQRPINLLWLAAFSMLLHLGIVWTVTHRQSSEPDVPPAVPEMVVEFTHSQPEQQQFVPSPPKAQPPKVIPLPDDVVIPVKTSVAQPTPVVQAPVVAPTPSPVEAPVETTSEPNANAAYLHNQAPPYPEMAERMFWEGTVWLHVHVLANGQPDTVEVQRSSGHSVLDRSAVNSVKRWTFVPAKRGPNPVDGWVSVPIEFKLGK